MPTLTSGFAGLIGKVGSGGIAGFFGGSTSHTADPVCVFSGPAGTSWSSTTRTTRCVIQLDGKAEQKVAGKG